MDYFRATAPAQTRPAGAFVSEIGFDKIDNLVNWKDISPRLGYGNPTEVFNGVDFSLNARLGSSGGLVAGGLSWGRVVVDNCFRGGLSSARELQAHEPAAGQRPVDRRHTA